MTRRDLDGSSRGRSPSTFRQAHHNNDVAHELELLTSAAQRVMDEARRLAGRSRYDGRAVIAEGKAKRRELITRVSRYGVEQLVSAFTPREVARDSFAAARSTGVGRVLGADPRETYEARRRVWRRVGVRVTAAYGTPRVFAREPDDALLGVYEAHVRAALDRLDAQEATRQRVDAERAERQRELAGPATSLVGPKRWLDGASGEFV